MAQESSQQQQQQQQSAQGWSITVEGRPGSGIDSVIEAAQKVGGFEDTDFEATPFMYGGRMMERVARRIAHGNKSAMIVVASDATRQTVVGVIRAVIDQIQAGASAVVDKERKQIPILVLCNKQDAEFDESVPLDAPERPVSAAKAVELFKLAQVKNPWFVQETVATEGRGIEEGMRWLAAALADPAQAAAMPHAARLGALPGAAKIAKTVDTTPLTAADALVALKDAPEAARPGAQLDTNVAQTA
jgi:hypothetical protein